MLCEGYDHHDEAVADRRRVPWNRDIATDIIHAAVRHVPRIVHRYAAAPRGDGAKDVVTRGIGGRSTLRAVVAAPVHGEPRTRRVLGRERDFCPCSTIRIRDRDDLTAGGLGQQKQNVIDGKARREGGRYSARPFGGGAGSYK